MVLISTETSELETTTVSLASGPMVAAQVLFSEAVESREEIRTDDQLNREILRSESSEAPERMTLMSSPAEFVGTTTKGEANSVPKLPAPTWTFFALSFVCSTSYLRLFGGSNPPLSDSDSPRHVARRNFGRAVTRHYPSRLTFSFGNYRRVLLRTSKSISLKVWSPTYDPIFT